MQCHWEMHLDTKIWADSIDGNQTSDLNWWMQSVTLPQIFSQFLILNCFEKPDINSRDTHSGSCVWPVGSCFVIISVVIIGCQTLDLEKCIILFFCENSLSWPLGLLHNCIKQFHSGKISPKTVAESPEVANMQEILPTILLKHFIFLFPRKLWVLQPWSFIKKIQQLRLCSFWGNFFPDF